VKGKVFASAGEIWDLLERVRGHNMAKGALEAAVWDAEAKQKGVPLSKLIGGVREEIACGVSVGIKGSLDDLSAAVQKELAAGYRRIKIKIRRGTTRAGAAPAPGFSAHQADGGRQLRYNRMIGRSSSSLRVST